jgi:hypothetical protein
MPYFRILPIHAGLIPYRGNHRGITPTGTKQKITHRGAPTGGVPLQGPDKDVK